MSHGGFGTCKVMSHVRKGSETCPDRNKYITGGSNSDNHIYNPNFNCAYNTLIMAFIITIPMALTITLIISLSEGSKVPSIIIKRRTDQKNYNTPH